MNFIKRFNDYSCVQKYDKDISEVFHYTASAEAVINISAGCFWATDIRDFAINGEDENEGYLILHQVLQMISDIDCSTTELVKEIIGTKERLQSFFDEHETYLVSTCTNSNSEYMWNQYAKKNGYQIVFDKEKLIKSLYVVKKDGGCRTDIFKHAELRYDDGEQKEIIRSEYQELLKNKDVFSSDKNNVEDILKHLMYVGNFYKKSNYNREEEYRILVNLCSREKYNIDDLLPERKLSPSNKHYIEIRFSPATIKKIVCASEQAKNVIECQMSGIEIVDRKNEG